MCKKRGENNTRIILTFFYMYLNTKNKREKEINQLSLGKIQISPSSLDVFCSKSVFTI